MRFLPLFWMMVLLLGGVPGVARGQRAIFLVRHAEKVDESRDPPLSPAGRERAARLGALLKDAGVTAIYTSEYQRTAQTAEPLARLLKLQPVKVPAGEGERLVQQVRARQQDGIVLIVSHGDRLPALLKAFGAQAEIALAPGDYDNLYVLVPGKDGPATLLRLHF